MNAFMASMRHMVKQRPAAYRGLQTALITSTAGTFAYGTLLFHPELQLFEEINRSIFRLVFCLLLILASTAVLHFVHTLLREQRSAFGHLLLLGATPRQVHTAFILSIGRSGLLCIGIGILLGIGCGFVLHVVGNQIIDLSSFTPTFHFSTLSCSIAVGSSFFILLCAVLFLPPLLLWRSLSYLLQGTRQNDRPPPLSRMGVGLAILLLSGMAVVCLVVRTQGPFLGVSWPYSIIGHLGTGLLLAILGGYFLYRQGTSCLVLSLCRKRIFAWQGVRLVWLRHMAHRLRAHSGSFYILSLVLIFVFLASGLLAWVQRDMFFLLEAAKTELGQQVSPLVYPRTPALPENEEQEITHKLSQAGFTRWQLPLLVRTYHLTGTISQMVKQSEKLEKIRRRAVKSGDQTTLLRHTTGAYMPAARYNQLLQSMGEKPVKLGPEDALLLCPQDSCSPKPEDPAFSPTAFPLPTEAGVKAIRTSPRAVMVGDTSSPYLRARKINPHTLMGESFLPQWILGEKAYRNLQHSAIQQTEQPGEFIRFHQLDIVYHTISPTHLRHDAVQAMIEASSLLEKAHKESPLFYTESSTYKIRWTLFLVITALLTIMIIFILLASSFLFARIYTDIESQWNRFRKLLQLGCPQTLVRHMVTMQTVTIFLAPLLLPTTAAFCLFFYLARLLATPFDKSLILFVGRSVSWQDILIPAGTAIGALILLQAMLWYLSKYWIWRITHRNLHIKSST